MNNERGGILSKIIIIPAGVVLMAGFFFLGYYVGRYQSKSGGSGEIAQPLPEIASSTGQKQEEFTFYKTLTDKTDRTVSIDLKPKPVKEENKPVKQQITRRGPKNDFYFSAKATATTGKERAGCGILKYKTPLYRADSVVSRTCYGRG